MTDLTAQQILEKLYHQYEYDECMEFHEFVNRYGEKILERYGKETSRGE